MGGDGGAVVRAVRADDRVLGAGVAVRLVLARPDAVGLLARSARARPSSARSSAAGSTGSTHWFNRQAEGYKRVIAWALDHRWSMVALATVVVRRRPRAAGARDRRRRRSSRCRTSRSSTSSSRRRPARTSRTRGSRPRRWRGSRGRSRRWPTPTRPSAGRRPGQRVGAVDEANVYVRLRAEGTTARSTRRSWRRSCGASSRGSAA